MMADTEVLGLCDSCRDLKPVAWADPIGREFCAGCLVNMPTPKPLRIMDYLLSTIPFAVGDRVQCRTGGILYDGIGVIDEVSVEPKNFGTWVYPSFLVKIQEKAYPEAPDELWYTEVCLAKVSNTSEQAK